jgi:hypothetical protein
MLGHLLACWLGLVGHDSVLADVVLMLSGLGDPVCYHI